MPSIPRILRLSAFQQQEFYVSTAQTAFSPPEFKVKPGLITSKQSDKQFLLVFVKSEQLVAILHPFLLLFGHEIPWNPGCMNFHHEMLVDYCTNFCMTERCCQLWFINGYMPVLHDDSGDKFHS
jgi:hypothetical protein